MEHNNDTMHIIKKFSQPDCNSYAQKHGNTAEITVIFIIGYKTLFAKSIMESPIIGLVRCRRIKSSNACIQILTHIVPNGEAPSFSIIYDTGKLRNRQIDTHN